MDLLERVNQKIRENRTEMISSLSGLVSIPSVVSEASGDRPFGENVHKAFKYMLNLASEEGFDTFNADNYGGHIYFNGRENGIA